MREAVDQTRLRAKRIGRLRLVAKTGRMAAGEILASELLFGSTMTAKSLEPRPRPQVLVQERKTI
jgi:hypothetical protein